MNSYYKFTYAIPKMLKVWIHRRILKKIKKKQSFHNQLTRANCIKSNIIRKTI